MIVKTVLHVATAGLTALSLVVPALAQEPAARNTDHKAELGKAAPDFTLADHEGNEVSLSDFAGKLVVLEWTNPDCPYVKHHYKVATMTNLATQYAEHEVVWLAVNSTHYYDQAKNQAWVAQNELPFPVLDDAPGRVGHRYGAKTTPHMFIVDPEGILVYDGAIDNNPRGREENPTNYVHEALEALIGEKGVPNPQTKPYGCSVKYAKASQS